MSVAEIRQLQAGGFVAPDSDADASATEEVVARRYGGPALGGRVVVQLSAKRLTPAVDLAMEYLGLAPAGESEVVARQHRQALGFADWALMRHPEHARYALDLVKRIKKAARRAKSKPGHAWEEFSAMAAELDRSVRHFLPPFWEEVARIFKDHGNPTYAGRALNKALEAERVHAVEVDREHRRDAVLEFTLGGCLSGKALSDYARDLQKQFDPPEAYATLRDLVVRRTLGGMAPTAATGTDLLRLAKAAKLDVDAEIDSVLEQILPAPAMARAPLQFWKSVSSHVKRLVAKKPELAMWLLVHTDPQASYRGNESTWQWLEMLDGWKVLDFLWKEDLPAEPEIPGGRAGWIGRLARLETSPDKRIFDILERSAKTLRREGVPIPLFHNPRWGSPTIDVDVLEACLDLELPLEEMPENVSVSFDGWLREAVDHPRRNSSLAKSYARPQVAAKIREQIPTLLQFKGEEPKSYRYGRQLAPRRAFEEAAENRPVVDQAWWEYLDGELVRLEQGGLPDAETGLANLRACVTPRTAERFPELAKRVAKLDLVDNLHRTLAAGVLDEYGWPALDEAAKTAPVPESSGYGQSDAYCVFPALLYRAGDELIVVRGDGWTKRKLGLKKDQDPWYAIPAGDDACVFFRDTSSGWKWMFRWLNSAQVHAEISDGIYHCRPAYVAEVDGGAFVGSRILFPGDTTLPASNDFFHDGERFWRIPKDRTLYQGDGSVSYSIAEVDPRTGKIGRESVPKFFEEDLPPGAVVLWSWSRLLPAPPGAPGNSPAGSRDGMIGWRVARRRDGSWQVRGIDGRGADVSAEDYASRKIPAAMLDQPCGTSKWNFAFSQRVYDAATGVAIADLSGKKTTYCAGWPGKLPTDFLHYLRVRHEPSSKRLRKLTRKEAATLLDAAVVHHQAQWDAAKQGKASANDPRQRASQTAVEKLLPGAPAPLVEGVARIARLAAGERASLEGLRQTLAAAPKESSNVPAADASRVRSGWLQIAQKAAKNVRIDQTRHERTDLAAHFDGVAEFLKGQAKSAEVENCFIPWPELIADLPAIAWRIFWRTTTDADLGESPLQRVRQPWIDALEKLAATGMLDLPGSLRFHTGNVAGETGNYGQSFKNGKNVSCTVQGDNRYVTIALPGYPQDSVCVLEHAPKGKFQVPSGVYVDRSGTIDLSWKSKEIAAFLNAARQVRELPFVAPEKLQAAAETLDVTPAEAGIVWMGDLRTATYGRDVLTKEIRDFYGWKTKQVQEALASLDASPPPSQVIGAPVRRDPAAPFGENREAAFDAMVAVWKKARGDVFRIPAELAKTLEASAPKYGALSVSSLAELFRERERSKFLQKRKFEFQFGTTQHSWRLIAKRFVPPEGSDFGDHLTDVLRAIRLLHYASPAGDPVRRAIPGLIDALKAWADDDSTVLSFGWTWGGPDVQKAVESEIVAKYEAALGKFARGKDGLLQRDDGLVIAALSSPFVETVFRPARLRDEADYARLDAVAALSHTWSSDGSGAVQLAKAVRELRSDEFAAIAALDRAEPGTPGSWDHDPRNSAPEIVAEAAKALDLSEESAVAYLQILALPDPTNANLTKRNGWTAARLKKALGPLVEAGLLVQAKRARAGRDLFLPGGWEALKAPNLPIESWKLPLYGLDRARPDEYRTRTIVPKGTVGELFRAAWTRYRSGDVPKYEEA